MNVPELTDENYERRFNVFAEWHRMPSAAQEAATLEQLADTLWDVTSPPSPPAGGAATSPFDDAHGKQGSP